MSRDPPCAPGRDNYRLMEQRKAQAMTREPIPNVIADCMAKGCQRGELRAEVERLRALSQNNAHSWDAIVRERNELRAEVERLRAEASQWKKMPLRIKLERLRAEVEQLTAGAKEAEADWQLMVQAWKDKADRRADEIESLRGLNDQLLADCAKTETVIERLKAESDISDGLLADAKAEIQRLTSTS